VSGREPWYIAFPLSRWYWLTIAGYVALALVVSLWIAS